MGIRRNSQKCIPKSLVFCSSYALWQLLDLWVQLEKFTVIQAVQHHQVVETLKNQPNQQSQNSKEFQGKELLVNIWINNLDDRKHDSRYIFERHCLKNKCL